MVSIMLMTVDLSFSLSWERSLNYSVLVLSSIPKALEPLQLVMLAQLLTVGILAFP